VPFHLQLQICCCLCILKAWMFSWDQLCLAMRETRYYQRYHDVLKWGQLKAQARHSIFLEFKLLLGSESCRQYESLLHVLVTSLKTYESKNKQKYNESFFMYIQILRIKYSRM
jgi:hypothetical protein